MHCALHAGMHVCVSVVACLCVCAGTYSLDARYRRTAFSNHSVLWAAGSVLRQPIWSVRFGSACL